MSRVPTGRFVRETHASDRHPNDDPMTVRMHARVHGREGTDARCPIRLLRVRDQAHSTSRGLRPGHRKGAEWPCRPRPPAPMVNRRSTPRRLMTTRLSPRRGAPRIEGPGSTWPRFVGVRHPKRCRRPQVGGGHHCGASVGRVIAGPGPRGERHPPRRRRARPERPRGGPIGPAVADRPRGGPIGPAVADRVERPDGPTQPPIHGRAIALDVDRAEHRSDAGPGRGSERGSDSCPDVSSPGPDHRPQARRDRGRRPADGELADVRQPRRDDDERLRQQREVLSARGLERLAADQRRLRRRVQDRRPRRRRPGRELGPGPGDGVPVQPHGQGLRDRRDQGEVGGLRPASRSGKGSEADGADRRRRRGRLPRCLPGRRPAGHRPGVRLQGVRHPPRRAGRPALDVPGRRARIDPGPPGQRLDQPRR